MTLHMCFWYNTDPALPYPHDVRPGASLAGFSISSTATSSELLSYGLSGWDHSLDQPGPTVAGTVLAFSFSDCSGTEQCVPPAWGHWVLSSLCLKPFRI